MSTLRNIQPTPRQLTIAGIGLIASVAIGLHSINLLFLLASFVALNRVIRSYLSPKVFDSKLMQSVVASFITFIILQCIILSSWVINPNTPLSLAPVLLVITAAVSALWHMRFAPRKNTQPIPSSLRKLTISDAVSLSAAVFSCFIMLIGPLKNIATQRINLEVFAIHSMDMGIDDSNHFGRINDRLQLDRGVLYRTDKVAHVSLGESISSYPAGWHSANAVALKAIWPNITVGKSSLIAYVFLKIFWMIILLYLFAKGILLLIASTFKSWKKSSLLTWATGAIIYFNLYMIIEQFYQGFFSFIPELISILLGMMILIQQAVSEDNSPTTLWLFIIVTAGATLSWILALPGFAIAIIAVYLLPNTQHPRLERFIASLTSLIPTVPIIALAALAVLVQTYLISTTSYRSFAQGINDPGGIYIHSQWYIMFMIAGVLLFVLLGKRMSRLIAHMLIFLAGLIVFATFIYLFQMATIHKIEYYTYKIFNTVFILAVPLAIAGFAQVFHRLERAQGAMLGVFLTITCVILLPITIGIEPVNTSIIDRIIGRRSTSDAIAQAVITDIDQQSKLHYSNRSSNTVVFNADVGSSVIMSNMLRTIKHVDTCSDRLFTAQLHHSFEEIMDVQSRICTSPLTVLTDDQTAPSLQAIAEKHNLPSVTITSFH